MFTTLDSRLTSHRLYIRKFKEAYTYKERKDKKEITGVHERSILNSGQSYEKDCDSAVH